MSARHRDARAQGERRDTASLRVAAALATALGIRVWLHEPATPVTPGAEPVEEKPVRPAKQPTKGKSGAARIAKPRTGVEGVGMVRADEVIDVLRSIPQDDMFRGKGLRAVEDWIKLNKKK